MCIISKEFLCKKIKLLWEKKSCILFQKVNMWCQLLYNYEQKEKTQHYGKFWVTLRIQKKRYPNVSVFERSFFLANSGENSQEIDKDFLSVQIEFDERWTF